MKKVLCILLSAVLVFSMAVCASAETGDAGQNENGDRWLPVPNSPEGLADGAYYLDWDAFDAFQIRYGVSLNEAEQTSVQVDPVFCSTVEWEFNPDTQELRPVTDGAEGTVLGGAVVCWVIDQAGAEWVDVKLSAEELNDGDYYVDREALKEAFVNRYSEALFAMELELSGPDGVQDYPFEEIKQQMDARCGIVAVRKNTAGTGALKYKLILSEEFDSTVYDDATGEPLVDEATGESVSETAARYSVWPLPLLGSGPDVMESAAAFIGDLTALLDRSILRCEAPAEETPDDGPQAADPSKDPMGLCRSFIEFFLTLIRFIVGLINK